MTLEGTAAVVIGASSGVGRATAEALVEAGVQVTAVARGAEGLSRLRSELGSGLRTWQGDAADERTAERLLGELQPDWVVLAAGVRPHAAPLDEQSWESFSEAWGSDTRAAFYLMRAALRSPLRPGSRFVVVSSGAAIQGSYISGGYAGAKRMQWLLAGYAQQVSDAKQLGLRFLAVLPRQLIEGTAIAARASSAYGAALGVSAEQYMRRFEVPLRCEHVAAAILAGLRGEVAQELTAIGVTGTGIEPLG